MIATLPGRQYNKYMEKSTAKTERVNERYWNDLIDTFGEVGSKKLMAQIAHDDLTLSESEVLVIAWTFIAEATAYALPASAEDLTESAINIYEGYEAHRRVQD